MEPTAGDCAPSEVRCAECGTLLAEGQDRQQADSKVFCRPCFDSLTSQVREAVVSQGQDVNYGLAAVGGILGAAVGVLVWWGVTVTTEYSLGIVALVIGFGVGKGVTMFSGNKRSRGLQILSVGISLLAFCYASYLVTRSFVIKTFRDEGQEILVPLIPDPALFLRVIRGGFGGMDILFLAIVLYEAWKIPAPPKLRL